MLEATEIPSKSTKIKDTVTVKKYHPRFRPSSEFVQHEESFEYDQRFSSRHKQGAARSATNVHHFVMEKTCFSKAGEKKNDENIVNRLVRYD